METRELLAIAYQRGGFQSWREMGRHLGISANSLIRIRRGHGLPGDELCLQLAQIAGTDAYTALLQLNSERTEGQARRLYEKVLRERVAASIAAE
ncbi:hypothetical protein [Pyruvatibacter mobilis]|uniref:hypothetical protein n=1 Tax=Pyruvatibacter mobilis TaxID=1712261 RepID=UPI003BABAD87